jgi:hypothetical protein
MLSGEARAARRGDPPGGRREGDGSLASRDQSGQAASMRSESDSEASGPETPAPRATVGESRLESAGEGNPPGSGQAARARPHVARREGEGDLASRDLSGQAASVRSGSDSEVSELETPAHSE